MSSSDPNPPPGSGACKGGSKGRRMVKGPQGQGQGAAGTGSGTGHGHVHVVGGRSTSSRSTGGQPAVLTKSESFLQHLGSLGYEPRKHVRAEHFDYVFHNRNLSYFVEKLLMRVKPENVLGPDELAAIAQLHAERKVLTGSDLWSAIERVKENERRDLEINQLQETKMNRIKARISDAKANIEGLKNLQDHFDTAIKDRKKDNCVKEYNEEKRRRERIFLDNQVKSQLDLFTKELFKLSSKLETLIRNLLSICDHRIEHNTNLEQISRMNWENSILEEDKLMESVKGIVEFYALDMILKEEADDPLAQEELQRVFKEHSSDINRLKHVFVYEFLKWVQVSADQAVLEDLFDKLPSLIKKAKNISKERNVIRDKMMDEIMASNQVLREKLETATPGKVNHLKEQIVSGLNEELKVLQDIKIATKESVNQLFHFIASILAKQRARFLMAGHLIKLERKSLEKKLQDCERFHSFLQQFLKGANGFQSPSSSDSIMGLDLDPNEVALFSNFGIPLRALNSHTTFAAALRGIHYRLEADQRKLNDSRTEAARLRYKELCERKAIVMDSGKEVMACYKKYFVNGGIRVLENTNRNLKAKLMEKKSYGGAQDSIERKQKLLADMKSIITNRTTSQA